MKRILLSGILMMCSLLVFAQSSNFKGMIYEEDSDEIVADALVSVEGTTLITESSDDGSFYFSKPVPVGDQVVTVSKEGYEIKYFIITVEAGKNVNVDRVEIEMTSKERKRRSKISKALKKEEKNREKEREDRIDEARKEREKKEKRLAKEKKRLKKKNKDVIVSYDPVEEETENLTSEPVVESTEVAPEVISPIQQKYGNLLGIPSDEVTNIKLFEFIDVWMGTTYRMGGATKEGIDCSSFSQRLFTSVYDQYIERTAQKQFDSRYTDKFQGKEFLKEGDLVFFKGVGESVDRISHVGVYLGNSRFVHSTSRRGRSGVSGVKISDVSDAFWTSRFVAGGRRINNN